MDSVKGNIAEQIQDLLKQININISYVLSKVIDDSPLTAHQMYIMRIIQKNPRINLKFLCKDMLLSKSSMSLTLNKLVENGYVLKNECPHDRRRIDIILSYGGEKILNETKSKVIERFNNMTKDFTAEDLEKIKAGLEKLYLSTDKAIHCGDDER